MKFITLHDYLDDQDIILRADQIIKVEEKGSFRKVVTTYGNEYVTDNFDNIRRDLWCG